MGMLVERQNVTVNTVSRVVQRINCAGKDWVFVYVKNSGATALNAFSISRGLDDEVITERFMVADSTADFADSSLIGCVTTAGATADPTTLTNGGVCALQVETFGCDYLEIIATVASSTTTLTFAARGK